jgi:hypothetical protein
MDVDAWTKKSIPRLRIAIPAITGAAAVIIALTFEMQQVSAGVPASHWHADFALRRIDPRPYHIPQGHIFTQEGVLMCSEPRPRFSLVVAVVLFLASAAHAGLILNFNARNPGNAQAAATIGSRQVTVAKTFTSLAPIDMEFTVNGGTGGAQQWTFTETVINKTGIKWDDYHVQIGFGTGSAFKTSAAQDGLKVNGTPAPASGGAFAQPPTLTGIGDMLDYASGNGIPSNTGSVLSFTMDIPDISSISPPFRTPDLPINQYRFTVRQVPTAIPVPPAVWIGGAGLMLAMGAAKWMRAKERD